MGIVVEKLNGRTVVDVHSLFGGRAEIQEAAQVGGGSAQVRLADRVLIANVMLMRRQFQWLCEWYNKETKRGVEQESCQQRKGGKVRRLDVKMVRRWKWERGGRENMRWTEVITMGYGATNPPRHGTPGCPIPPQPI